MRAVTVIITGQLTGCAKLYSFCDSIGDFSWYDSNFEDGVKRL